MQVVQSPSGAEMVVDGRPLLNFGGSCYLGLGHEKAILQAGQRALAELGAVCQLPRHYGFECSANAEAERAACDFFDAEAAMFVGTGYLFGLIAIAGLAADCDAVFIDASAHYNLREGALAAGLPVHLFAHRDAADLERALRRELAPGQRPLVATDGMFPTFGTVPPLADYAALIEPLGGWLLVDESHAFGALGATGGGAVEHAGLDRRSRVVAGGSAGKALAAHGGLVVGSRHAIELLWRSPAARGAALGSTAAAAMVAASLEHLRANPRVLPALRANARLLKEGLHGLGLRCQENPGPIATFTYGSAARMQGIQAALLDQGIFIIYSTYVGAGPEGALRVAAFADHRPEHFQRLFGALKSLL